MSTDNNNNNNNNNRKQVGWESHHPQKESELRFVQQQQQQDQYSIMDDIIVDTPPEKPEAQPEKLAQNNNKNNNSAEISLSGNTVEVPVVLIKAVLGEMLCTMLFIFIVCSTGINFGRLNNTVSNPVIGAVSTGFAAVALIYSFADVSGANFNPAVSFATWITGKIHFAKFLLYVSAQLIGAVLATTLLLIAFPGLEGPALVVVKKSDDARLWEAFIMEVILTFILVYVIFATAFDSIPEEPKEVEFDDAGADLESASVTGSVVGPKTTAGPKRPKLTIYTTSGNTKGGFAPIAIGFTLGFLNFCGGTVSGGAFNPARVFGPALLARHWDYHWLYWVADFLGAGLAGYVSMIFAHNNPDPLVMVRPIMRLIRNVNNNNPNNNSNNNNARTNYRQMSS